MGDPTKDYDGYDGASVLERPHDILNRIVAGYRAAAVGKLLFDESEVCVILGCSTELLKTWRRTPGEGPTWVKLGGRLIRYPRSGLEQFVAALQPHEQPARVVKAA